MAPSRQPIAEFLAEAPEPPSFVSTRAAVAALKSMEALDQWEDVTELGRFGPLLLQSSDIKLRSQWLERG